MRDFALSPRKRDESGREYAYRVLRDNIITLTLPPGEVLNEHVVADKLSISRTPVREALFTLRKENMVVVRPQSGSTVSLIDADILRQGLMMLVMVEMEIMRRLCGALDAGVIRQLQENLKAQRATIHKNELERPYLVHDDEFHRIFYLAAHKENVYNNAKALSSQLDRVRVFLYKERFIESDASIDQHYEIYVRMVSGVWEGFPALYLPHRMGVEKYIPAVAAKYPDYFAAPTAPDARMRRLAGIVGGAEGLEASRAWD